MTEHVFSVLPISSVSDQREPDPPTAMGGEPDPPTTMEGEPDQPIAMAGEAATLSST